MGELNRNALDNKRTGQASLACMSSASSSDNNLCICPNHHVLFDKGAITLGDGHDLLGMPGRLTVAARHLLLSDSLQYHREHIYQPLDEMLS